MLVTLAPEFAQFSRKETICVDHPYEIPVIGKIALAFPVANVVAVVAVNINTIQQEGNLAAVSGIDPPSEAVEGVAIAGFNCQAVVLVALGRNIRVFCGIAIQARIGSEPMGRE